MSELEPTITELEPTATERLRALLDERGVEWMPSVWSAKYETFYKVGEVGYLATEMSSGRMKVGIEGYLAPEQAIAAILGSSNCSNDCTNGERTEACRLEDFADVPFSVDYEIEGYDMGSSRDYATLAECSSCGAYVIVPPSYHHVLTCDGDEVYQPYRFCPNCGRRIEVDDG